MKMLEFKRVKLGFKSTNKSASSPLIPLWDLGLLFGEMRYNDRYVNRGKN